MKTMRWFVFVILLYLMGACSPYADDRVYDGDGFSFTIPPQWATFEEVWDRPQPTGVDFYGLGVETLVTIQTPTKPGKGVMFFSVAGAPLADGETLPTRFQQAYAEPIPAIEDAQEETLDFNGSTAYATTYRRPWGEPWWQFRDVWLEQEDMVYVLSFHCSPGSFADNAALMEEIIGSVSFDE